MESFALPVLFPPCDLPEEYKEGYTEPEEVAPTADEQARLEQIINEDPLYKLTPEDEKLLLSHPTYCKKHARALPKFMRSYVIQGFDYEET